jgi:hypothetical protein
VREGWRAEQQRQQTNAWSPGQAVLNSTGARQPVHTVQQPAPIVARIVWEDDGEELIETVAAGWSGQFVYVRLPDRRYRLTSVAEHGGRSTALEDPGGPSAVGRRHAKLVEAGWSLFEAAWDGVELAD